MIPDILSQIGISLVRLTLQTSLLPTSLRCQFFYRSLSLVFSTLSVAPKVHFRRLWVLRRMENCENGEEKKKARALDLSNVDPDR